MNINLKSIVYRQNSPQKFKNRFAIKKSKWSIEKNYFFLLSYLYYLV